MKLFAIAFGIVCGVAAVFFGTTFVLLSLFDHSQAGAVASASAGIPMLVFPKVAEFLEQQQGKKGIAAGKRTPVYDFAGFQVAWPLMVVYGTIVLWSVGQATAGILGLLFAAVTAVDAEVAVKSAVMWTVPATLMTVVGSYFVGRWVGSRISRRGIVTVLLIALLTAAAAVGIDVLFLSDKAYRDAYGSERLVLFDVLRRVTLISFIVMPGLLIGYWRGHKQKLSKYLHYLLGVLPPETRDTVVELAFEEAKKVPAATGPAPHPRLNVDVVGGRLQPAN